VEKQKCIFVIGTESSGSTFIARVLNHIINVDKTWNGRGFNCCNDPDCDKNTNYTEPCRKVSKLICHRSLPFNSEVLWPPISEWRKKYDCYFVICTRDLTISELSRISRFGRSIGEVKNQSQKAREIIFSLINSDEKIYFWSYESFMFLGKTYLRKLLTFLNERSDKNILLIEKLRDGNVRYILK